MAWAVSRRPSSRAWQAWQPPTCSATRALGATSSSWSIKAESPSSVGAAGPRGSLGMHVLPGKEFRVLLQPLLDLRARAGDPRLHRAQWHPQHTGDLVVGHAVHVAQHDGNPHVVVERLDALAHQPVALPALGPLLRIGRGDAEPDAIPFVIRHRAVSPV